MICSELTTVDGLWSHVESLLHTLTTMIALYN
jgi:hypothetical protein